MSIGYRILSLIKDGFRLNKTRFAQEIQVPPTTIKSLREDQEGVTSIVIAGILKRYPQVNADWLLFGVGDMFLGPEPTITNNGNVQVGNGNTISIAQHDKELREKDIEVIELRGQVKLLKEQLAEKDKMIQQLLQK